MRNLIQVKKARITASAAAVLVALTALLAVGQENAASASKAPLAHKTAKFKQPKLKRGLLTIEGRKENDVVTLRLEAGQLGILQIDVGDDGSADFAFELAEIQKIAVEAGAGDDVVRIDESNGAFTNSIPTTIDGEDGDDVLAGGSGAETLLGDAGVDSIDGNRGNDVAFMGGGDDTFVWDLGDGSDTIEGQDGLDRMLFNGANVAEQVELSANGPRLRFFRNVASVTMDTDGVERVDFNALGGADLVTVNDLSGTDVSAVNVDLGAADGQPDRVVVKGTNGYDAIAVTGDAAEVKVSGLPATVAIFHPEAANDRLEIDTQAGRDTVDPAGLAEGTIQLFVNGALVP
jgi:Ca2+-binding RTX toxin-like protein